MDWPTISATGIAALAGGAGAYLIDWGRRSREREKREAEALLRAGLNLFHIYWLLISVRQQFVIPVVMEGEFLMRGEFTETAPPDIRFDLDALGFLMATPDEILLANLLGQENGIGALWPLMKTWSRQHREWVAPHGQQYVQPVLAPAESLAGGLPKNLTVDFEGLRAAVGRDNVWRMQALAEDIIKAVETQLEALPNVQAMIRKILAERYPSWQKTKLLVTPFEPLKDAVAKAKAAVEAERGA